MSKHLKINALPGWLYPFVWIGLSWGGSMMVAGVAAVHIIQVEPFPAEPATFPLPDQLSRPSMGASTSNKESLEPVGNPQAQTVTESDRLPFLTLGLVAFSCALGCFLMSHRSKAKQVYRANASPIYRRLPRNSSSMKQRSPSKLTSSRSKPLPSEASKSSPAQNASENAAVTVLATGEIHPLDWNEPSVADNLDLRQRRPLSYWL